MVYVEELDWHYNHHKALEVNMQSEYLNATYHREEFLQLWRMRQEWCGRRDVVCGAEWRCSSVIGNKIY
jgi:hypothetical protein